MVVKVDLYLLCWMAIALKVEDITWYIRKLNWKPEVNLKEGLKRTLADFKLKFNVKY